jgi:hypothetical protein
MPKKHILVVLSNPVAGKEDEYNDWYSNTHLKDQLKVPGFVGAQRFKLSPTQMNTSTPAKWQYACVWEIEADDPAEAIAETRRRLRTEAMPIRDDTITDIWAYMYEAITPRLEPK